MDQCSKGLVWRPAAGRRSFVPFVWSALALTLSLVTPPGSAIAADGGLSFVEPLTTSLVLGGQQGAWGIAQGDFDGDGTLDLAATDNRSGHPTSAQEGGSVHVMIGRGDGRFEAPTAYPVPHQPNGQAANPLGILAKDFDRDGKLDLVTVSPELRQVLFLRGMGNGTFTPSHSTTTTSDDVALQAGDVDGDQILDLVVLSPGSNTIEILLGLGDGSFEKFLSRSASGPTDAALIDIDGDGDLDLLLSLWGENRMKAYLNPGNGDFPLLAADIDVGNKQVGGFFAAKFDNDGFVDLVVAGPYGNCPGNAWVFIRGRGDGTFDIPQSANCIFPTDTPLRFGLKYLGENVAPDLDEDGHPDVLFWGNGNTFERGRNNGDGTFTRAQWVLSSGPGFDQSGQAAVDCNVPQAFVAGDFDGNGKPDVVVASQAGNGCRPGGVSLIPTDRTGAFRSPTLFGTFADAGVRSTALADFDEDGRLDLLFQRFGGPTLVAFGNGDGTFVLPPLNIAGAACTREARVGDFDGDGHRDFACISALANAATVGFGNGHGSFEIQVIPYPQSFGGQPSAIAAADFNGDERTDLAIVYIGGCSGICSSSDVHFYLLGAAPTRTFVEHPQVLSLGPPDNQFAHGLAAADFNEDGTNDLVFRAGRQIGNPGVGDDRFLFVPGNGNGTFGAPVTTRPGIGLIADLDPFDFDGDSHLDLLAVTGGGFWIFLGNGDGSFAAPVSYETTASNAFEAEIADLDADGIEDVVVASGFFGFSSPLSIFKGRGDGTFQRRLRLASGFDANMTVDIGDLDGDGRPDLITQVTNGGPRNDNFAVLLNNADLPDLSIQSLIAPDAAFSGDPIQLSFTATNATDIPAVSEWNDGIYLSGDSNFDKTDILLGEVHHGGDLGAGEGYSESPVVLLPEEAVGSLYLILVVDHEGRLGEQNEGNNRRSRAITISRPLVRTVRHGGVLNGSETWESGVVHLVTDDVIVPNGRTLTLAPGAIVKFALTRSLIVQPGGHLIAQGTVPQPIHLTSVRDDSVGGDTNRDGSTSAPSAGDWRKLWLDGDQTSLDHLRIRYGGGSRSGDSDLTGAVELTGNAQLTLSNSTVRDSRFDGILTLAGSATIRNCLLTGNDRAVLSWIAGNNTVVNSTLDDNRQAVVAHGGAMLVTNCILSNNLESGVQFDLGAQPVVRHSNVYAVPGSGARTYANTPDQTGANGNLSVDPGFANRARDNFRLAYGSPCIDAADGSAAPLTDIMGAPRYDDPRTVNTGIATSSGSFADLGAYELVEDADSDIDLIVSTVSGPATALAGTSATIEWTVTNVGSGNAVGPWHDRISLTRGFASEPLAREAGEILVGTGVVLGPGESHRFSSTVRVPGAVSGSYRWQVAANSRREVFEGRNTGNNLGLSTATVELDVPELIVGGAVRNGQLAAAGEEHWYKVNPPDGADIRIALSLPGSGIAEIDVRREEMPGPRAGLWQSPTAVVGNTAAVIPAAAAATYYVLLHAVAIPATTSFTMGAAQPSFGLNSVAPNSAGIGGKITLDLRGGQLGERLSYELIAPSGQRRTATSVYHPSSTQALVTFDSSGLPPGAYDVRASDPMGPTNQLDDALRLNPAVRRQLEYTLGIPAVLRARRTVVITVGYSNPGDTDVKIPVMTLEASDGTLAALRDLPPTATARQAAGGPSRVTLFGAAAARGILTVPPGGSGTETVYYTAPECGADVTFNLYGASLDEPIIADRAIDWDAISDRLRPAGANDQAWAAHIAVERARFGDTYGELCDFLSGQLRDFTAHGLEDAKFVDGRWYFRFDQPSGPLTLRGPDGPFEDIALDLYPEGSTALSPSSPVGGGEPRQAAGGDGVPKVRVLAIGDNSSLGGAVRDARKLEALFAGTFNVNKNDISTLTTEGKQKVTAPIVLEAMRNRVMGTDADDITIITTSNHGCYLSREGYFAQYGNTNVSGAEINMALAGAQGTVLFIADTCQSGGYTAEITNPHVITVAAADFGQLASDSASLSCAFAAQVQKDPNGDLLKAVERAADDVSRLRLGGAREGKPPPAKIEEVVKLLRPGGYRRHATVQEAVAAQRAAIPEGQSLSDLRLDYFAHTQTAVIDDKGVAAFEMPGDAKQPAMEMLKDQQVEGEPKQRGSAPVVCSLDPNAKVGPRGTGPAAFVPSQEPLIYTIYFENDPRRASAAAQEVVITDALDADLDWTSFRPLEIGFGDHTVTPPPGVTEFTTTVTLVPEGIDLEVRIDAGVNLSTGVAHWHFVSADPDSGLLTEDPILGFLPVNDASHRGEGFVTFSIEPRAGRATGTLLQNSAAIVFDTNAPLITNAAANTIDADAPESSVSPLPPTSDANVFVRWSGRDDGAGIASFDIYSSIDGGPFARWLEATTALSAIFLGEPGHSYEFYSVARDSVGHVEETPLQADASTMTTGCAGDCDGSGVVTIDELVSGVNIAVGSRPVSVCRPLDTSSEGLLTFDEILQAVRRALAGCGG